MSPGLMATKEKPPMDNLKKMAMRTGIVLTGSCGVVLLGGGKVMSGTLLVATAFIMVLPVRRHRIPRWARVGLICAVFAVVIGNISTTDLPNASMVMAMGCANEQADTHISTGFTFLDQVSYIFNSFISQAEGS